MRRTRIICGLFVFTVTLLTLSSTAFAQGSGGLGTGGQGWYGETNDKVITNAMFLTILFFPVVILVLSLIQWRLDRRKHSKMDAAKRRAANADWRGGW